MGVNFLVAGIIHRQLAARIFQGKALAEGWLDPLLAEGRLVVGCPHAWS